MKTGTTDRVREYTRREFIEPARQREARSQKPDPLARFWGIGKDVFDALGGGEAFIRSERENFCGSKKEHA